MDLSNEFSYVCEVSKIKDSIGMRFYINDKDIALLKVNGEFYAVSNICPHQQVPKIYEGFVEDNCVVCPLHGWKFKLAADSVCSGRGIDSYPVKVLDGKIFIKVEEKKLNW